jgi:cellulose synthase/poly-beta-1,6-N-acetylglucosamine synthase-like glycosyltransferase
MKVLFEVLQFIINYFILLLTLILFSAYIILAVISAIALRRYLRKNSYVDYNSLLLAPLTPSVSIIAPAFNEEKTIVDNIRALLSLYYNNFEVIVVNDGSKDKTFQKIIEAYNLEKVNYFFDYRIPCERIRGVYKSKNRSFKRLTVIDKVNGGKSDALNAGLNISKNQLICSIDVDSIMEPDALLRLAKPFMEQSNKKVIGTGGVIRIANSCEIEAGQIKRIRLPKKFLPRVQVLEYTRSFLMSRMAWGKLNGLLIISGALGMFDKEVAIKCGGYKTSTVGEDMEIVVRMRRHMCENKLPYTVVYIPDPLVWTEVPSSLKILGRQRNRWTRGTIETLAMHKNLFLNPKYGVLGLLSYPYWTFFEWLAPIVECIGLIYFTILVIFGQPNWSFFFLLLAFVLTFAISMSTWAVLFEEVTFHKYKQKREILRLIIAGFLEPIFFHPLTVYWAIRGNIDYLRGIRSWGKMDREGFQPVRKSKKKK